MIVVFSYLTKFERYRFELFGKTTALKAFTGVPVLSISMPDRLSDAYRGKKTPIAAVALEFEICEEATDIIEFVLKQADEELIVQNALKFLRDKDYRQDVIEAVDDKHTEAEVLKLCDEDGSIDHTSLEPLARRFERIASD
jgi:hypothetical protein